MAGMLSFSTFLSIFLPILVKMNLLHGKTLLPFLERANNFPPLPKFVKIKPCFYQNIEEEIPAPHQQLVRRVYILWMSMSFPHKALYLFYSTVHTLNCKVFPMQCTQPHCASMWYLVLLGGPGVEMPPTLALLCCGSSFSALAVTPAGSDRCTKPSG